MYCSTSSNIDQYQDGQSKIVDKSQLVKHITDARQVALRIEGLSPETTYYLAVELVDMSGLIGYAEVTFDTIAEDTEV